MTDITELAQRLATCAKEDTYPVLSPADCGLLVEALETIAFQQGEIKALLSSLESRTVKLPPLNDDLISILGRPNFMCAHLAELLRKSGEDIKRKAEHEQAAIIHWFLGIYLEHGDKWEGIAKSDIQARVAGIKWEAE
ncbi:hypothetical protein ACX9EL_005107 [Klebsiella oxytoca]